MNKLNLINKKIKDELRVLSENELRIIIDNISSRNDLILTVTQGGMGFYPVYNVLKGNYIFIGNEDPYIEKVISFSDKQLPAEWSFDKLSEFFNSTSNLKKIEFFKQEIPRKKDSYYY